MISVRDGWLLITNAATHMGSNIRRRAARDALRSLWAEPSLHRSGFNPKAPHTRQQAWILSGGSAHVRRPLRSDCALRCRRAALAGARGGHRECEFE